METKMMISAVISGAVLIVGALEMNEDAARAGIRPNAQR